MLIRPLHGAFVEVLGLAWSDAVGITHSAFEPMAHHSAASASARALPTDLRFEEIPMAFAIDIVTTALWNHRRLHGALPACVEHFADMFSLDRAQSTDRSSPV